MVRGHNISKLEMPSIKMLPDSDYRSKLLPQIKCQDF